MVDHEFHKITSPFTVLVLVARKPGTTFEQFTSYYENQHVPLVTRLLQGENCFTSYTRHFINRDGHGTFPFGNQDSFQWDCIARSEYIDEQAYKATLEVFKEHLHEIDEDEKKFMDQSKTVFIIPGEGPGEVLK